MQTVKEVSVQSYARHYEITNEGGEKYVLLNGPQTKHFGAQQSTYVRYVFDRLYSQLFFTTS